MASLPLLLATMAAAVLAASPVASAKPGGLTFPAERFSQLTVRGTQGFQITIKRTANRVELTASNGKASAIYIAHSKKNPVDGIEAVFPGLGKVSVRFHPSGPVRHSPALCGGRAWFRQNGIFRGVIKFEGERRFTRVAMEHARGFVFRSFKETCEGGNDGSKTTPIYYLAERAKSQGRVTAFTAMKPISQSAFDNSSTYFASQRERRHGMTTIRIAVASTDPDAFALAGPPTQPESATITPPSPFSGTAGFQASLGTLAKWEGTLAVELPGVGSVLLTGPQFRPELCREQRCLGRPHQ
jgi:hypothetical protein